MSDKKSNHDDIDILEIKHDIIVFLKAAGHTGLRIGEICDLFNCSAAPLMRPINRPYDEFEAIIDVLLREEIIIKSDDSILHLCANLHYDLIFTKVTGYNSIGLSRNGIVLRTIIDLLLKSDMEYKTLRDEVFQKTHYGIHKAELSRKVSSCLFSLILDGKISSNEKTKSYKTVFFPTHLERLKIEDERDRLVEKWKYK